MLRSVAYDAPSLKMAARDLAMRTDIGTLLEVLLSAFVDVS